MVLGVSFQRSLKEKKQNNQNKRKTEIKKKKIKREKNRKMEEIEKKNGVVSEKNEDRGRIK